jgi:nucleotide-binding universal stress UspA family protein
MLSETLVTEAAPDVESAASQKVDPQAARRGPVLLALTGRESSKAPAEMAWRLAQKLGLELRIVSIIEPIALYTEMVDLVAVPMWIEGETVDSRADNVRGYMRTAVPAGQTWNVDVRYGEPIREISRAARELDATVIVVGASPRVRGHHVVSGQRAAQLLRVTQCPVLSVAPGQTELPRQILAAMDFGAASLRALQAAVLVAADGATVTLVHVAPEFQFREPLDPLSQSLARTNVKIALDKLRDSFAAASPAVTFNTRVVNGPVLNELLSLVQELNADLVAAGTHGPNVIERFFVGSVAGDLLRFAPPSVLASPARGPALVVPLEQRISGTTVVDRPDDWKPLLDAVARRNHGRRVTVEVDDESCGAQMQSHGYQLTGIAYDPGSRRVDIMLGAGPRGAVHLTRGIERVNSVAVNREPSGRDRVIEIAYDGGHTLVTFES